MVTPAARPTRQLTYASEACINHRVLLVSPAPIRRTGSSSHGGNSEKRGSVASAGSSATMRRSHVGPSVIVDVKDSKLEFERR